MVSKLKYLFVAEYFDGTHYKQNREDCSRLYPPVTNEDGSISGKSSFTDIKEDATNGYIKKFSLKEDRFLAPRVFSVDLTDGHFEIDGTTIVLENESFPPQELKEAPKFTLIYFRTKRVRANVSYSLKTGAITKVDPMEDPPLQFVIGWQCTVNGINHQQKIRIE